MVEAQPGYWLKHPFIAEGITANVDFVEAACPICDTIVRENLDFLMKHRYALLSTPEALEPA